MQAESELLPAMAPPSAVAQPATPTDLLAIAVQQGADLDRLERLMELQSRWESARARDAYNVSLAAFKSEAIVILKSKRVSFENKSGGRTNYKHAELSSVIDALGPALSKHGFAWSWDVKQDKDWIAVTCTLRHAKGHSEQVTMGGPPDDSGGKNRIQGIGSTVTYLQRYTLKAITGVAEQGDDNDAKPPPPPERTPEQAAALEQLLDAGRDAAMNGTKALTAWWSRLSESQRKEAMPEFGAMKLAARKADAETK